MSPQIVQARCPGCKNVLRIPAEWVHESMRCKHCGLVFQAQARSEHVTPAPATSGNGSRPAKPAKAIPVAAPAPAAVMAAPVATGYSAAPPVAAPVMQGGFEPLVRVDGLGTTGRKYRRRGNSVWPKVAVLSFFFLVFAAGAFGLWKYYPSLTEAASNRPATNQVAHDDLMPNDLPGAAGKFPRRMLVVSVNNYLYANPVNYGSKVGNYHDRTMHSLIDRLGKYMHVDQSQIYLLSDSAPRQQAKPPMKVVIENAIQDFLKSSRKQDRLIVFFIGHAVEVDDEPYLVPLEGEMDNPETLIPLKWVYDQLKACPARQKVLMLDVCRYDPGRGTERPGSGPMGEKFDEALQNPPEGVQVFTMCTAGEYSFEFENGYVSGGVMVNQIPAMTQKGSTIQEPNSPLPLDMLIKHLGPEARKEISYYDKQAKQTMRLTGTEMDNGAAFDPDEPLPPRLVLKGPPTPPGGAAGRALVDAILQETEIIPPVKMPVDGGEVVKLTYDTLPPFSATALRDYNSDSNMTPMRQAVKDAVDVLVKHAKAFPDRFPLQRGNENEFKEGIIQIQKLPALAQYEMEEALEELRKYQMDRESETSKRWQANYDYVMARLIARIAYVHEYNFLLGQMRRELPEHDPDVHSGFQLSSRERPQSGREIRNLVKEAHELLEKIVEEHPGTPYEILAKREKFTTLGLEWQPVKFAY
ncbi:MAG: caspase domain-containing protein [Gemmataceae bacterium]